MRNQRKKVVHLLTTSKLAGAERVAINIIRSLSGDFDFKYVSPYGEISKFLDELKIPYQPIKRFTLDEIWKLVNQYQPDVIHAHDYRASVLAASVFHKGKVLSHIHSNAADTANINLKTILYSIASIKIDSVIVVSPSVLREAIFRNLISHKTTVIPNIIDISEINGKTRSDAEYSDILYVGRLSSEKNPLGFIDVISDLARINPNIKTIMIGDGPLKSECEAKIRCNNLNNNVKLLGFSNNPYSFMVRTKVLLAPSKWEGFGLAVLEALSLGIPVVASRSGGLVDLICHGKNGYLCSSPVNFVEYTSLILGNESLRNELSTNALKMASKFNDITSFREAISRLYWKVM